MCSGASACRYPGHGLWACSIWRCSGSIRATGRSATALCCSTRSRSCVVGLQLLSLGILAELVTAYNIRAEDTYSIAETIPTTSSDMPETESLAPIPRLAPPERELDVHAAKARLKHERVRADVRDAPSRFGSRGSLIIIAATALALGHALRQPTQMGANDISRWCTVWSLLERGTLCDRRMSLAGRHARQGLPRSRRSVRAGGRLRSRSGISIRASPRSCRP